MTNQGRPVISVVVPVFNEAEGIDEFYRRLTAVLQRLTMEWEILFVNDGSNDDTLQRLRTFRHRDARVAVLDLSRNFGKEIALTAGLDHASGDAVVVIDADLQDPPEVIPELVARWRDGYDVIYARRIKRDGESWAKKATAAVFYRVMGRVGAVPIPEDTGDYRLLSRRAVQSLSRLRERHRFMKGLFAWIGFRQIAVYYVRDPRFAGSTKWNYWKLWNFALEGFTSFTIAPLKLATYLGLGTALFAFAYGALIITRTVLHGSDVPGYASIMVTMLFLGSIQLIALGVLGEYIGRMFNELKQRPLYLVDTFEPSCIELTVDSASTVTDREVAQSAQGTDSLVRR